MNRRPNIAIVDDEPGVRKGLSRLLRAANLNPCAYASAQEFLDNWEAKPPDCVVMDLYMPGVSGHDVQARLKQAGAKLPVIIVTARDEREVQEKCLELGATAYLSKPLDGEVLLELIRTTLAQHS